MTTEERTQTAQTISLVARSMLESRCDTLPEHLVLELAGIAADTTLPETVRREAALLLEESREA